MAKKDPAAENKPRIGRPRADRKLPAGPVREEILQAARALFREKGFAATSTREIASAVGLRQPSLFHYFKNKNEIFRAVALGAVAPVLEFIETEHELLRPPDVALHRLVWFDVYHLCTNENVLGVPFQFPELNREDQAEFWAMRDRIIDQYRVLLKQGAATGVFSVDDEEITTHLLFALGESTLTWYRNAEVIQDAKIVSDIAADLALRAVLSDVSRLPYVRETA